MSDLKFKQILSSLWSQKAVIEVFFFVYVIHTLLETCSPITSRRGKMCISLFPGWLVRFLEVSGCLLLKWVAKKVLYPKPLYYCFSC